MNLASNASFWQPYLTNLLVQVSPPTWGPPLQNTLFAISHNCSYVTVRAADVIRGAARPTVSCCRRTSVEVLTCLILHLCANTAQKQHLATFVVTQNCEQGFSKGGDADEIIIRQLRQNRQTRQNHQNRLHQNNIVLVFERDKV